MNEHHYWEETGHSEYWRFSHATGWIIVSKSEGEDWTLDSYVYRPWNLRDGAIAKKGLPPRVWI